MSKEYVVFQMPFKYILGFVYCNICVNKAGGGGRIMSYPVASVKSGLACVSSTYFNHSRGDRHWTAVLYNNVDM